MRKLVALAFGAIVIPMVMGATVSNQTITVNPGGAASKIKGEGTWTLGDNEFRQGLRWEITLKGSNPVQTTGVDAGYDDAPDPHTWQSTMLVAAATYNPCKITLSYINMKTKLKGSVSNEDKTDHVVK